MQLYKIADALIDLSVQAEAYAAEHEGEIPEDMATRFDALELAREDKIGNIGCMIKNFNAETDALSVEAKKLLDRAGITSRRATWLKNYLAAYLGEGEKYKDARVVLSWRRSASVDVLDADKLPEQFVSEVVTQKIDKRAIGDALKAGSTVSGAVLIEKQNLQVK